MKSPKEGYRESLLTKTKIVATVGPACETQEMLRKLVLAGVDIFRLNFAHGDHAKMSERVAAIRDIAADIERPVGILGDLGGPKIRLGPLPGGGLYVGYGLQYSFVREADHEDPTQFTTTYDGLIDDLKVGDPVLLADGTVSLRVVDKAADEILCVVEQPGQLFSGQGVNLPGVDLRLPSITQKDCTDLAWALEQELDFVGLSFVRRADDIRELRRLMQLSKPQHTPLIVAKIEKPEAVDDLDAILAETDALMVARGDLGVEVDIVRVPMLQKRIIRACNRLRVPVITATQMLDSMQNNNRPTRPEASDVANAVLDGSDAVMLSGETAIGNYPVESVTMMSRIVCEAQPLVVSNKELPLEANSRNEATLTTRAVTLGAMYAAEQLKANMIAVLTESGKSAIAISGLRSPIPILAMTDSRRTARRLTIAWGVNTLVTDLAGTTPGEWVKLVETWGKKHGVLETGHRVVLVGDIDLTMSGKDLFLVHTVE